MQQQFDAQRDRIQKLSDVVLESRKDTQTNADTLHNLLVGIENLGENVKNMQEEMIAWQAGYQEAEREYEELLQEVPLPAPAVRPQGIVNSPPNICTTSKDLPVHSPKFESIAAVFSWSCNG